MKEYKSFLKSVGGNEGDKCYYSTRIDTYGCGCQHDCSYCYAKSLLNFRNLWNPEKPTVADWKKIRRAISGIAPGTVVRLGGMTDCFQPLEKERRNTWRTINELNRRGIGYLIVTKSDLVAEKEYIHLMDRYLAHIQITVTCTDDDKYTELGYEKAPLPSKRIAAIERLQAEGFDVQLRLSPFIPEFIDYEKLNAVKCDKILVEFLRVNSWIKQWFDIDYSEYTLSSGGYWHLPLERKKELLKNITGFKELSVCEDEDEAYKYWAENVNPKMDCCNLRGQHARRKHRTEGTK